MIRFFKNNDGDEYNFWMSYTDLMSGFLVVFIIVSIIMYNHYSESKARYDKLFDQLDGMTPEEIGQRYLKLTQELDSLKGADLRNLIFEYQDVFVPNEYINVRFDTLQGSIGIVCQNSSRYLFASGSDHFEPELKDYLDKIRIPLVEKTMQLWKDHDYYNVELRIEGHTDPQGRNGFSDRGSEASFLYNLDLSSRRANRVYEYILEGSELSFEQKEFVKKNMISVGYSFATRVYNDNVDDFSLDAASRRIEFRIISK